MHLKPSPFKIAFTLTTNFNLSLSMVGDFCGSIALDSGNFFTLVIYSTSICCLSDVILILKPQRNKIKRQEAHALPTQSKVQIVPIKSISGSDSVWSNLAIILVLFGFFQISGTLIIACGTKWIFKEMYAFCLALVLNGFHTVTQL